MNIGDRVVVRRTAGVQQGRQRYTDVLGELVDDGDNLCIRTDDGELVTIAMTEVAAAKTIPPKPTPYRQIAALEQTCADSWPAPHTQWMGGWLMRAGNGWTNRANTVLTLGEPGVDLDTAITEVTRWYDDHGLSPGFAVPLPLARRLATALAERGWQRLHNVVVLTAPLNKLLDVASQPVTIDNRPGPQWLQLAIGTSEPPLGAMEVLGSGPDRAFAGIGYDHLRACGRGAIAGDVVVLSRVVVEASQRRQGLAGRIVAGLAEWGAACEATTACVQVLADNSAAMRLYQGLGFAKHHEYVDMRMPEV